MIEGIKQQEAFSKQENEANYGLRGSRRAREAVQQIVSRTI